MKKTKIIYVERKYALRCMIKYILMSVLPFVVFFILFFLQEEQLESQMIAKIPDLLAKMLGFGFLFVGSTYLYAKIKCTYQEIQLSSNRICVFLEMDKWHWDIETNDNLVIEQEGDNWEITLSSEGSKRLKVAAFPNLRSELIDFYKDKIGVSGN